MAVFYEFSTNMTMELLNKIIEKVEMAGAKEETLLAKPHLQTALENDSSPTEFRKAYKIKKEHLECKGNERQRVYLATQLLSSSVSSLMRQSGMHSQANLLQIFDDFFDVFNSK